VEPERTGTPFRFQSYFRNENENENYYKRKNEKKNLGQTIQ